MPGIYTPRHKLHQSIRIARLSDNYLTHEEEFEQMFACALFMTKVFQACRDAGVTPRSATGSDVNLTSIMIDTEMELDIYLSPPEIEMLNKFNRYQVEWSITRRRRYCYAVMYRMTSGSILN